MNFVSFRCFHIRKPLLSSMVRSVGALAMLMASALEVWDVWLVFNPVNSVFSPIDGSDWNAEDFKS